MSDGAHFLFALGHFQEHSISHNRNACENTWAVPIGHINRCQCLPYGTHANVTTNKYISRQNCVRVLEFSKVSLRNSALLAQVDHTSYSVLPMIGPINIHYITRLSNVSKWTNQRNPGII